MSSLIRLASRVYAKIVLNRPVVALSDSQDAGFLYRHRLSTPPCWFLSVPIAGRIQEVTTLGCPEVLVAEQ